MKQSRRIRAALFTSLLSVVLCVGLLTGTTFAWFTSTTANTGNTIVTGNFDAGFSYRSLTVNADGSIVPSQQDFQPVREDASLLGADAWNPGEARGLDFQITNSGKVALLNSIVMSDLNDSALADKFEVYVFDQGTTSLPQAPSGVLSSYANSPLWLSQQTTGLAAGGQESVRIVVRLRDDISAADFSGASVNFRFALESVQASGDADGFGDTNYDKDAIVRVGSDSNLSEVIANVANGAVIYVEEDISLAEPLQMDAGKSITLNLMGNMLSSTASGSYSMQIPESASLKVVGGTISTQASTYCFENEGTLELQNVTLDNSNLAIHNFGTLSLYGSVIHAAGQYGICNYDGTIDQITDTYIEVLGNGCYAIDNSGTSTVREIRNSTLIAKQGSSGLFTSYAIRNNSTSSVESMVNCTVDGALSDTGIQIASGTFTNSNLNLEQFTSLVASGSQVTQENGTYVVQVI